MPRLTRVAWLILLVASLPLLLHFGRGLLAEEQGEDVMPAPRKGRPHPQVTYKGTSPYFKVERVYRSFCKFPPADGGSRALALKQA